MPHFMFIPKVNLLMVMLVYRTCDLYICVDAMVLVLGHVSLVIVAFLFCIICIIFLENETWLNICLNIKLESQAGCISM